MLLYHDPRAPNPRRVRIFLAEKGVPITFWASFVPWLKLKIAVQGSLLPVLELSDGRVLRESMAICRYIEEIHPEPNLFGADTWERAQIEQWNRHAELELLLPTTHVFRNTHAYWNGRIKQAPEFGEIMREQVTSRLDWLDSELAQRPYLAGQRFTVADITALCALDFGKISNLRIKAETQPNLAAWYARVNERPSTKA